MQLQLQLPLVLGYVLVHSYQQYLSARSELTEIDFPNVNPSFSTPFPASIGVRLGRANYSWTAQQLALTLTATIHGPRANAIYKEGFYFTCLSIRSLASISFFVGIHICFSKMANQTTSFRSFLFWAGYPHCLVFAVLWLSSFIVAKK